VGIALEWVALRIRMALLTKTLWLVAAVLASKMFLDPLIAGLLRRRGGFVGHITNIVTAPLRGIAETVRTSVESKASIEAAHQLRPATKWLHAYADREGHVVAAQLALALATAEALERGFGHTLPREIGRRTRPIDRRAKRAGKIAAGAALGVAGLRKLLHDLERHRMPRAIRHAVGHAAGVAHGEVAREGRRARAAERALGRRSTKLLRRVAALGTTAYLSALLIKALARRLPWTRCSSFRRMSRKLNCFHFAWIADVLLATVFEALALRDLCRLVGLIEDAGTKFERPLIALVNEIEGFVCGGDESLPSGSVASDGRRVALRASGL
jgi:hypothetical protein